MTAAQRREAVTQAMTAATISERRACSFLGIARSTARFQSKRPSDLPLRTRLVELATERPRWGYRRLHVLLRREGKLVNHKRVYRVYSEAGLAVRRRKRKRVAVKRTPAARPTALNERWSMDFVSDGLSNGRRFRCLTLVDDLSREGLAIEVDTSLPGQRVVRVLEEVARERGLPDVIVTDNGPEFIGQALDQWAHENGVELKPIEPGSPWQNCFIESFNGIFRDECLNENWFTTLADARQRIEAWRQDYNRVRPHGSLGSRAPSEFHELWSRSDASTQAGLAH